MTELEKRPKAKVKEISSKFASLSLGMDRKIVSLKDYSSDWGQAFLWIKSILIESISVVFQCEHIGSTSIIGMPAKPALDILCLFNTEKEIQESIEKFESLGFVYKGDAVSKIHKKKPEKGRHFFSFYDLGEKVDYAHLHIFSREHPEATKQILFRDCLQEDKSLALEYEVLKKHFQDKTKTRQEYTRGKKDFVERVLKLL